MSNGGKTRVEVQDTVMAVHWSIATSAVLTSTGRTSIERRLVTSGLTDRCPGVQCRPG